MIQWGVGIGALLGLVIVVSEPLLAVAFTRDHAVRDLLFSALLSVGIMQPLAGAVFVLDGILIGAGDSRYLAAAMALATLFYLPVVALVSAFDGGLVALWAAFSLWVVARLVGMGARFATDRWAVTGAVRPS
jgi:Na+-driven multidrug efflux pump